MSAVTRRCAVAFSRGKPKGSPQAVRTAGATCTTTILSGSARASKTRSVSSRSRSAPVGQWVMHWPQRAQSESSIKPPPRTPTQVWLERLVRSQMPSAWTFSHTWMQRRQLMHLSLLRMSGKSWFQGWCGRCLV